MQKLRVAVPCSCHVQRSYAGVTSVTWSDLHLEMDVQLIEKGIK